VHCHQTNTNTEGLIALPLGCPAVHASKTCSGTATEGCGWLGADVAQSSGGSHAWLVCFRRHSDNDGAFC
jgi:hypothetical protein